jgi:hypothetical protein
MVGLRVSKSEDRDQGVIDDGWIVTVREYGAPDDIPEHEDRIVAYVETELLADLLVEHLAGRPGPFHSDVWY